jgi:hypothetical protein
MGLTLLRGMTYLAYEHIYGTVARHAYPVIIPTMVVLCFGWLEIADWINAQSIACPGERLQQMGMSL